MLRYKIKILGLSEISWCGAGKTKLTNVRTIIYSGQGNEDERRERGVAFMMDSMASQKLLEW